MQNLLFLVQLLISCFEVHLNLMLAPWLQRFLAERRLIRTIRQAYNNVPFYRQKYDEAGIDIKTIRRISDIKRLPFLTKDDVRNHFPDAIVAQGVNRERCHYSATTGSTGRSLPFLFSPSTLAFYIATGVRMYTMIGYRPWHKVVYIKYTKMNYPKLGPLFRNEHIKSTLPIEEQIAQLRCSKPDLLIGYASIIFEIACRMSAADLELIKPKFIGLNSEMSTQPQRDFIAQVFGCPVYDEYSTEETWMIAAQCRNHRYHIFTDNVWVEILDQKGKEAVPGEMGEIILTTTRSKVMPFIRYRIGDLGSSSNEVCKCGIGFPVLQSFDGRSDDLFILPSGKQVSSLKILNTFTMYIKKHLHLLEEFKVIQQRPDLVIIEIIKGKDYADEHIEELIQDIHKILLYEPIAIKIEFVDAIHTGGSIKRKAIESQVHGKGPSPGMQSMAEA